MHLAVTGFGMAVDNRIREYYDTLREGEPLYPFFADDPTVVKFGITEQLTGYDEIEAGLREQTRTTEDWTVESENLRVGEQDDYAWFSDEVFMAWRDAAASEEYAFDSRWSGTLERRNGEWLFVGMHVSTVPAEGLSAGRIDDTDHQV